VETAGHHSKRSSYATRRKQFPNQQADLCLTLDLNKECLDSLEFEVSDFIDTYGMSTRMSSGWTTLVEIYVYKASATCLKTWHPSF